MWLNHNIPDEFAKIPNFNLVRREIDHQVEEMELHCMYVKTLLYNDNTFKTCGNCSVYEFMLLM